MSKVYAVITVARQIEGEYVFIKTEKAFTQASKADALVRQLKQQFVTPEGKIRPVQLATDSGSAECYCEVGAFEIQVEE